MAASSHEWSTSVACEAERGEGGGKGYGREQLCTYSGGTNVLGVLVENVGEVQRQGVSLWLELGGAQEGHQELLVVEEGMQLGQHGRILRLYERWGDGGCQVSR